MDEAIGIGAGVLLTVCFIVLAYLAVRAINGIDFDDDDPGSGGSTA